MAKEVVRNGYVLQAKDITVSNEMLALCIEDRAKLVEIRQHLSFTAWNRLQSAIAGFSTDDTVCHDCKRRSGEGRQNTIKWVQCDACVHWLHLNCVGLSRQPRGNWFCSACDA